MARSSAPEQTCCVQIQSQFTEPVYEVSLQVQFDSTCSALACKQQLLLLLLSRTVLSGRRTQSTLLLPLLLLPLLLLLLLLL
jgi:hypothetical protein